jgi:hypothetical protein
VKKQRTFATGATRSPAEHKPRFGAYLSPLVLRAFGEFMLAHNEKRGRAGDNWKLGFPVNESFESLQRHNLDLFLLMDGFTPIDRDDGHEVTKIEALMKIIANAQFMAHELLKESAKK